MTSGMKVEIDLNDILGDEYGSETLQESVRRQVIESLTNTIKEGVGRKIDAEVAAVINAEIKEAVKAQMPTIVNDLLNAEYTPVDRYGDRRNGTTTFRKELVSAIHEQMKYVPGRQFDSEKNAFTKAVDEVVKESVTAFKKDFDKLVNAQFVAEAMKHASKELAKRLGVSAA